MERHKTQTPSVKVHSAEVKSPLTDESLELVANDNPM
jgi:hypothetical protein